MNIYNDHIDISVAELHDLDNHKLDHLFKLVHNKPVERPNPFLPKPPLTPPLIFTNIPSPEQKPIPKPIPQPEPISNTTPLYGKSGATKRRNRHSRKKAKQILDDQYQTKNAIHKTKKASPEIQKKLQYNPFIHSPTGVLRKIPIYDKFKEEKAKTFQEFLHSYYLKKRNDRIDFMQRVYDTTQHTILPYKDAMSQLYFLSIKTKQRFDEKRTFIFSEPYRIKAHAEGRWQNEALTRLEALSLPIYNTNTFMKLKTTPLLTKIESMTAVLPYPPPITYISQNIHIEDGYEFNTINVGNSKTLELIEDVDVCTTYYKTLLYTMKSTHKLMTPDIQQSALETYDKTPFGEFQYYIPQHPRNLFKGLSPSQLQSLENERKKAIKLLR